MRRRHPQTLQVHFLVRRVERAAFDPPMPYVRVLDEPVAVRVGRRGEPVRAHDRWPRLFQEFAIAARAPVIGVSDHVQRRRIGARPWVRIPIEPGHERRRLRDLVRNLSIGALEPAQERERGSCGRKIAFGVGRKRRPQRVATEEPCETGAFALARRPEPGQQSGTEQGIGGDALVQTDLRPLEGRVEPVVRRGDGDRLALERLIVICRSLVERLHRSDDSIVRESRGGAALDASGDHDRDPAGAQEVGCDLHHEAVRNIARLFLIWHHRDVARVRTPDDAGVAAGLLAQRVDVRAGIPAD